KLSFSDRVAKFKQADLDAAEQNLRASVIAQLQFGDQQSVSQQRSSHIKLLITFLQLANSVAYNLVDVPIPSVYQSFISVFSVFKLDIFPWSQLSCLATIDFYTSFL